MRRVAELISVADVLGIMGLGGLAYTASTFDVRYGFAVISIALILVAVAYSRPPKQQAR
jgi:hypothetical protein